MQSLPAPLFAAGDPVGYLLLIHDQPLSFPASGRSTTSDDNADELPSFFFEARVSMPLKARSRVLLGRGCPFAELDSRKISRELASIAVTDRSVSIKRTGRSPLFVHRAHTGTDMPVEKQRAYLLNHLDQLWLGEDDAKIVLQVVYAKEWNRAPVLSSASSNAAATSSSTATTALVATPIISVRPPSREAGQQSAVVVLGRSGLNQVRTPATPSSAVDDDAVPRARQPSELDDDDDDDEDDNDARVPTLGS